MNWNYLIFTNQDIYLRRYLLRSKRLILYSKSGTLSTLNNGRQTYLESLWSNDSLDKVLEFYKEIKSVSEMVKFSAGRKPSDIKIIRRGDFNSDLKFIIPTMDHNSQQCKMLEKKYEGYGILFIESSGKLFNYAKSVNAGISAILDDDVTEITIISNDDIMISSSALHVLKSIRRTGESVYCLKPQEQNYSGEKVEISVSSPWEKFFEMIQARIYGFKYHASLISALNNKKINYTRAFFPEFLFHRFLMIGSKPLTGELVNFADFGIFKTSILRENRFDETFINGWEDWDLSYRLKQRGIEILPLDMTFIRNAHSSIGRVMTKESEYLHSYLNRIYFYEKHTKREG